MNVPEVYYVKTLCDYIVRTQLARAKSKTISIDCHTIIVENRPFLKPLLGIRPPEKSPIKENPLMVSKPSQGLVWKAAIGCPEQHH